MEPGKHGRRAKAIVPLFAKALVASCFIAAVDGRGAHARPLQIIHTNDLHSHLDHANEPDRGGYAAVKAAIDKLKWDARSAGIDTLVLDAGDFSEDSQYYLANGGVESWRAMNAMGYDAVTIGNHDWLAGLRHLDWQVGQASPLFAFLGANFIFTWSEKNLTRHMRQWVELDRAGARIAVYGLTTDDWEYNWMADPGFINAPLDSATRDLPKFRGRNDYVIALTHLGLSADEVLASRVPGIDLIVGGHTHTTLKVPVLAKADGGRKVPIVQTGMHGRYVGDLLVDVEPGKPLEILRYQLVPVHSDGPRDEAMEAFVRQARKKLDDEYGAEWLREVVGHSEVPLENAYYKGEETAWSRFVAESIREAGQAELAIDATQFEGFDQPAGPITREQLFTMYPRIFEFSKPKGWTVWTAKIEGWVLKIAINRALGAGMPVHFAGVAWGTPPGGGAKDWLVNGKPIDPARSYKVALPEGIVRGAYGLSRYLKIVIKKARDTGVPIWAATERRLRRVGTIKEGD